MGINSTKVKSDSIFFNNNQFEEQISNGEFGDYSVIYIYFF